MNTPSGHTPSPLRRLPLPVLLLALVLGTGWLTLAGSSAPEAPGAAPAAAPAVDGVPTRVVLTPADDTASAQSFSWLAGRTTDTSSTLEIQSVAGDPVRTLPATDAGNLHFSVTADGLTPGTSYNYRVGTPGAFTDWKTFTTADPADIDWRFVYYGDAQVGLDTTWPEVVRQARAKAPDALGSVHAGDLVDTGGADAEWLSWFDGMAESAATTNVLAAPGNHDGHADELFIQWKAHFAYSRNNPTRTNIGALAAQADGTSPIERQYAAYYDHWADVAAETIYYNDYQDVRFITLNASGPFWNGQLHEPPDLPPCEEWDCPEDKVTDVWAQFQAAWLDLVLDDSPTKWNVVTFHQPVYSASVDKDEPKLRSWWVPVFQEHDVDLVLMGHDHVYARGFNNADATATPGMTTGPVYVVSNSGAKHYELDTNPDNVWTRNGATQVRTGERVSTYQVIDVSADALRYRSYLAEKAPGASTSSAIGSVFDEFTVTKYDDGTKYVTEPGVPVPGPPPAPAPPIAPPPPTPTATPPTRLPTVVEARPKRLWVMKKARVAVVASVAGEVRVTLKRGRFSNTRTVSTDGGRSVVRLPGRLPARPGKVMIRVTLTPAERTLYDGDSTVVHARSSRRS